MYNELNKQKALRLDEIDAHNETKEKLMDVTNQFHIANRLNAEVADKLGVLVTDEDGGVSWDGNLMLERIVEMQKELDVVRS